MSEILYEQEGDPEKLAYLAKGAAKMRFNAYQRGRLDTHIQSELYPATLEYFHQTQDLDSLLKSDPHRQFYEAINIWPKNIKTQYLRMPPKEATWREFIVPHIKFAAHDIANIGGHNMNTHEVFSVAQKKDPQLIQRWIKAAAQNQNNIRRAYLGVATNLDKTITPQMVNIRAVVHDIMEILYFRTNWLSSAHWTDRNLTPSTSCTTPYGDNLFEKLDLENHLPDIEIMVDEGSFFLTVYNILKNATTLLWDYGQDLQRKVEKDPQDERAKSRLKNRPTLWIKRLKDHPFTLKAEYTQTSEAHIIHLSDTGPGMDLNMLIEKISQLISRHGIEYLKESGWIPSNLLSDIQNALSMWEFSPYAFFPHVAPHLGEIAKIYSLSGTEGHSGSGLHAVENMINSCGGTVFIGQKMRSNDWGTYMAIIIPKKQVKNHRSDEIIQNTKARLASSSNLIPPLAA